MRRISRIIIITAIFALFIALLRVVLSGSDKAGISEEVKKTDLVITTSISGQVKVLKEASLSFPISGRLGQIASEGAEVEEGVVVAMLDTFDLYSAYQTALANLTKARSAY